MSSTDEFVQEWRNAAYNCYSIGPQVLPRGLPGHAGRAQRVVDADRLPRQRRRDGAGRARRSRTSPPTTSTAPSAAPASCAARTRCSPATSTASAPAPSTSSRRSARSPSSRGIHQPGYRRWNLLTDERTPRAGARRGDGGVPVDQAHVADWAAGLDLPIGGETILFVDCEAAFYRTSVPRAVAQILQRAGVEFGLMGEQWCCGGPAAEMGYAEQAQRFAAHNLDDWRADRRQAGDRARPARLHHLHRGLPEVLRRRVTTSRSCSPSSCSPS